MTNWILKLLDNDTPKYLAIADAIENDVRTGILKPGDRLPTQRDLADYLGVNVSTVTRGYKEAIQRRLLSGTVGRGTYVSIEAGNESSLFSVDPLSSRDMIEMGLVTPLYDLDPSLDKTMQALLKKRSLAPFQRYSVPGGLKEHREAGALWAKRFHMPAQPDQVIVFSGVQHGLSCCLMSLFKPGDRIAVENLTYPGIRSIAALTRIQLVPVEMDESGMNPEALDAACRRDDIHGIYLMPGLHNPTAIRMPDERKEKIAETIIKRDLILIEDDAYALTIKDANIPISSLIQEKSVYFAGLSKVFWAGLRVGFGIVSDKFKRILSDAVLNTAWMTAPLNAALVSELIMNGEADIIAAAKREEASIRYQEAVKILKGHSFAGHDSGFFIWLHLPKPWTGRSFENAAYEAGVRIFSAEKFAVGGHMPPSAARISLTGPDNIYDLQKGLGILSSILKSAPIPEGIL